MRPARQKTNYIVVHCSATPPNSDIGVAEIDKMHRERGWEGIGYHFVIRKDGTLETGENMASRGAHVKGYNSTSVGICLVGGLDERRKPSKSFTSLQFITLKKLITFLLEMYPEAEVAGHRDFSPDLDGDGVISSWEFMKECPCFPVKEWWSEQK